MMDEIQNILSNNVWSPDTIDSIVDVLYLSGREILDVDEMELSQGR
jgi:hypothetical protein